MFLVMDEKCETLSKYALTLSTSRLLESKLLLVDHFSEYFKLLWFCSFISLFGLDWDGACYYLRAPIQKPLLWIICFFHQTFLLFITTFLPLSTIHQVFFWLVITARNCYSCLMYYNNYLSSSVLCQFENQNFTFWLL